MFSVSTFACFSLSLFPLSHSFGLRSSKVDTSRLVSFVCCLQRLFACFLQQVHVKYHTKNTSYLLRCYYTPFNATWIIYSRWMRFAWRNMHCPFAADKTSSYYTNQKYQLIRLYDVYIIDRVTDKNILMFSLKPSN